MAWHSALMASTLGVAMVVSPCVQARDLGNYGEVFAVTEPDFLAEIMARLKAMEADGGLAKMERDMQDRTRSYAMRPRSAGALPSAEVNRAFDIDLTIQVDRDLADHKGQVFAPAGTVVNPLAYSHFRKTILFIDGDDPEQVEWAVAQGTELDSLIVLIKGAPLELMRKHGRRFWFDQDGVMTGRFQIARLPSRVFRMDPVMRVEEVALQKGKR